MKKSKVIIPAMAMILFSTAASISGTVAWFTANRVFNTTIGNFSVTETEGNLNCTLAAGIGTTYDSTTKSVSVRKNSADKNAAILTHGSVNALTTGTNFGKAYVVDQDTGNTYVSRGTTEGDGTDGWLYRKNMSLTPVSGSAVSVDVYIAVSWTMTFTYDFGGETKPVAIFLDLGESKFENVNPDTGYDFRENSGATNLQTGRGFRIGFYNAVYEGGTTAAEYAHNVVWGNNVPVSADSINDFSPTDDYSVDDVVEKDGIVYKCITAIPAGGHAWKAEEWTPTGDVTAVTALSYVAGTGITTGASPEVGATAHTATNYVHHLESYTKVASNVQASNTETTAEKICVLNSAHSSVTVTCAAWFEGTDPNVVSGNAMNCLSAKMSFYARSLTA